MPETRVSPTNLRIGAHLSGWLLTAWSIVMTLVFAFAAEHTTLGSQLASLGWPHWVMLQPMILLAALQLAGHVTRSRRTVIVADLWGVFLCLTGAAIIGYATLRGDDALGGMVNWLFVGVQFLLHSSMLRQHT